MTRPIRALFFAMLAFALLASSCSSDEAENSTGSAEGGESTAGSAGNSGDDTADGGESTAGSAGNSGDDTAGNGGDNPTSATITLVSHDSFNISEETLAAFTEQSGITVELLESGDAGQMVSEAALTAGNPVGDVIYGVDNANLQRALDAGIFAEYRSSELDRVDDSFELDETGHATPINYGDVCINYWKDAVDAAPSTLSDLTDPAYADQLVVQNPETSSPGLAFLLATILGTDDWEAYWQDLRDNGVAVTAGWSDAYYGEFVAGGGERPLVVSYASSPPAEVIFAEEPIETAPTGVMTDSCFRQVEFAGVLAGTEHPDEAGQLIDFMLSTTFQDDVPLNMFVFPVVDDATLPAEFVEHTEVPENPKTMTPAEIEAGRDEWTQRWTEIVLG